MHLPRLIFRALYRVIVPNQFYRLCLGLLCRQSKGWSNAHILLCDITDSMLRSVKADSLFSYQPPVNLFALCVLLPLSYVLTPRWFHKV